MTRHLARSCYEGITDPTLVSCKVLSYEQFSVDDHGATTRMPRNATTQSTSSVYFSHELVATFTDSLDFDSKRNIQRSVENAALASTRRHRRQVEEDQENESIIQARCWLTVHVIHNINNCWLFTGDHVTWPE